MKKSMALSASLFLAAASVLGRTLPTQQPVCKLDEDAQNALQECVGDYALCSYTNESGSAVQCCLLERSAMNWTRCALMPGDTDEKFGTSTVKWFKLRVWECDDYTENGQDYSRCKSSNGWQEAPHTSDHFKDDQTCEDC